MEIEEWYDMPRTTLSSMINKRSWCWLTDEIDKEFSKAA